ncbi:hypothetical protein SAMN05192560_0087 [Methylobacillus rhizosphaerae]|uniref:DUF4870 domain-containing protein n=1 Tax=Methylobacillus rhizosphaerae TaxID=551994 RepID=A0A238XPB0_9PROT|nr:DUF4870 domain-containing protein [Methylobacillus rhizosphaerae]SNR60815.1 hypothetical protein SAMN05192560_0087 [Methylobacillus rhizosphaerae]
MSDLITVPNADEKNIAVLTHLGGTLFSVFPALIVWMLKKDNSPFVGEHAREALNFQITLLIGYVISSILMYILIGFMLAGILWVANIVFCILAAIAASNGEEYRYPFTLRLIS